MEISYVPICRAISMISTLSSPINGRRIGMETAREMTSMFSIVWDATCPTLSPVTSTRAFPRRYRRINSSSQQADDFATGTHRQTCRPGRSLDIAQSIFLDNLDPPGHRRLFKVHPCPGPLLNVSAHALVNFHRCVWKILISSMCLNSKRIEGMSLH